MRRHPLIFLLTLAVAVSQGQGDICGVVYTDDGTVYLKCENVRDISFVIAHLTSINKTVDKLDIFSSPQLVLGKKSFEDPVFEPLTRLHLDRNNYTSIQAVTVIGLPNLEDLDLEDNYFGFLEGSPFTEFTNLTELSLTKNRISSIGELSFSGLHKLESLSLSVNNIKDIDFRAFQTLSQLRKLKLDRNKFESLDGRLFDNILLEELDLALNNMKNITDFPINIPSLTVLSLADCNINSFPVNYFQHLPKLIALDLEGNQLTLIEGKFLAPLSSLRYINLYNNKLTSLDVASFNQFHPLLLKMLNNDQLPDSEKCLVLLRENPWNCSTNDLKALKTWFVQHDLVFEGVFDCQNAGGDSGRAIGQTLI